MGRMNKYGGRSNGKDYFRWLCEIVNSDWEGESYLLMLSDLFNKEFIWFVENDDNRYFDAVALRQEYYHTRYGEKVSVFEVLVTIAQHMDDNLYDVEHGERVGTWFWEMMENLELSRYDDSEYNAEKIDEILEIWLNRQYSTTGKGGVFPVAKNGGDQRGVEIWYQMSAYLLDKYEF